MERRRTEFFYLDKKQDQNNKITEINTFLFEWLVYDLASINFIVSKKAK